MNSSSEPETPPRPLNVTCFATSHGFGHGTRAVAILRTLAENAPGLTVNAERVELFLNSRETEEPSPELFYLSESVRQVTFSAGQRRQVVGEYAHFWSFRRVSETRVDAVVVTAVYADPLQLERLFVKVGGSRPLVVFSHGLSMTRES